LFEERRELIDSHVYRLGETGDEAAADTRLSRRLKV
jgi:hypothetical protein